MNRLRTALRPLGPAVSRPATHEIFRAAAGAGAGLVLTGLMTHALIAQWGAPAAALIAPFGASAFLIFAVPNSPLAQPWSAVVGNGGSALAAIAVGRLGLDPALTVALSVALAVIAMMALRAMHPPGGAVALLIALTPAIVGETGAGFALYPVAAATSMLVLTGIVYNRATGRKYPFRQPPAESPHRTRDAAPDRRLGLSAEDLGRILGEMRLAANIGPEDLARLIGVAEAEATARHVGGLVAADVMSHDLVTAPPDADLGEVTHLFLSHGFKSLPVTDRTGRYLGLVTQADVLRHGEGHTTAGQLATDAARAVPPDTPLATLLGLIADGGQQSIPVIGDGRLAGIVTRSDIIAALAFVLSR